MLFAIVGTISYIVSAATRQQMYYDVATIPKNKVGLLLGTAKFKDKGRNITNLPYTWPAR